MRPPIEELAESLATRFPGATVTLRRPIGSGKTWWIDLKVGPNQAEVEWHPDRGFGLSLNSTSVYGASADESFDSVSEIFARIKKLISAGSHTDDASTQFVRSLREGRKLTQTELATLLQIKQASVSRLEGRTDYHLSTLHNIVDQLGGVLEIRANFPDGSTHIVRYDATSQFSRPRVVAERPSGVKGDKSKAATGLAAVSSSPSRPRKK
jgi:predicted XRE-type DNA-binding protein